MLCSPSNGHAPVVSEDDEEQDIDQTSLSRTDHASSRKYAPKNLLLSVPWDDGRDQV